MSKVAYKASLRCQINDIVNIRVKQVFLKIKAKQNHSGKGTEKDLRKASDFAFSISSALMPEF